MKKQNTLNTQTEEYKKRRNAMLDDNGFEKEIEGTNKLLQLIRYNPVIMEEYQEELFSHTIDKVIIRKDGDIVFRLINNLELTESMIKG